MKKRLLSGLMALVFCLSLLPALPAARAEEPDPLRIVSVGDVPVRYDSSRPFCDLIMDVDTAYSFQFHAAGGQQPYTWQLGDGAGGGKPEGFAFDAESAVLSGRSNSQPYYRGWNKFTVTDQTGASASVIVQYRIFDENSAPQLLPKELWTGTENQSYSGKDYIAFEGAGSATADDAVSLHATWSVVDGALPRGVTLIPSGRTGEFSGTPTESGTFSFTVQVSTLAGKSQQAYTMKILPDPNRAFPITVKNGGAHSNLGETITTSEQNKLVRLLGINPDPKTMVFSYWKVLSPEGLALKNADSETNASFEMPYAPVSVEAVYFKKTALTPISSVSLDGVSYPIIGEHPALPAVSPHSAYTVKPTVQSGWRDVTASLFINTADAAAYQFIAEHQYELQVLYAAKPGFCFTDSTAAPALPASRTSHMALQSDGQLEVHYTFGPAAEGPLTEHALTFTTEGGGTIHQSHQAALMGTAVTVTAVPDPGYQFSRWNNLSDAISSSQWEPKLSFTMPDAPISGQAVFSKLSVPHRITVENGFAYQGSTSTRVTEAKEGEAIQLCAENPDPEAYDFVGWVSEDVTLSDALSQTDARFTMPDAPVTVRAQYKEKPKPIASLIVENIVPPVVGEHASFTATVPAGSHYTVRPAWKNETANGETGWYVRFSRQYLTAGDTFEANTSYSLYLTFIPEEGWTFDKNTDLNGSELSARTHELQPDGSIVVLYDVGLAKEKNMLSGLLTLSGQPLVGTPITAAVARPNVPESSLEYRWYRGETLLATSPVYTPTEKDLGFSLHCTVTSTQEGYSGELTLFTRKIERAFAAFRVTVSGLAVELVPTAGAGTLVAACYDKSGKLTVCRTVEVTDTDPGTTIEIEEKAFCTAEAIRLFLVGDTQAPLFEPVIGA